MGIDSDLSLQPQRRTYAPDERRPSQAFQFGPFDYTMMLKDSQGMFEVRINKHHVDRLLALVGGVDEHALGKVQAERAQAELENQDLTARIHRLEDTVRALIPYREFFDLLKAIVPRPPMTFGKPTDRI